MQNTTHTIKSLDPEAGRVGGYLVVWGSPEARDRQGEYFTQETELGLDWYPVRPVLFHHGIHRGNSRSNNRTNESNQHSDVIGTIEHLKTDQRGVWAEATLNPRHEHTEAIQRMVDDGVLSWSSGSLSHLVQVADDGRIMRWPIVEGGLTPRPAETRHTDVHSIKSAYDALGLDTSRLTDNENESNDNQQEEIMPEHTQETQSAPIKRLPMSNGDNMPKISVSSPYDRYDAGDLLHGYMMLRSVKSFHGVSERYANALAQKINGERLSAIKADELSYSTQTGYGDEWVPELWSDQIWQKARMENTVLPLFRAIEMPSNPFTLPVEGTDPQVYYVSETMHESQLSLGASNPIPDSKIGTGKLQIEARKLALRVGFTSELVEDAIVPVLNIYREQAVRAIADSIDYVLINGDTETEVDTNINMSTGSPVGNERYLAFDGLRKLPLMNNLSNLVGMSGAPTLAKLRETRFAMAARYSARPSDLAWIVDPNTYAALLNLPEFLTMDKAGTLATAQTGQIGFIDGIPVFVSAELGLATPAGTIDVSGNTTGTALCVYRPGWFVGYRRRIAVNVDYLPYYDSYQLTATVRLGFQRFDDDVAAALINIVV